MTHIVLTAEQETILNSQPQRMVQVCRPDGTIVGYMATTPSEAIFTAEEIAEAKRRANSDEPRHTTQEVLAHLRSLEQAEA